MPAKTQETRTYTAHLLAELLATPDLPSDLHQAITDHLAHLYSRIDIRNPEYCRRLYPILVELAELSECSEHSQVTDQLLTHSGNEVLTEITDDL